MKILTIIGTRPEAIKMAPILKVLNSSDEFEQVLCATSQHEHMLDQVLELFDITPDIKIQTLSGDRTLASFFSHTLSQLDELLNRIKPDAVMVHGDTSSTLSGAMAAYYHKIPVIHIEAGLRTNNIYSPWPEEINRKITACITKWHFSPTDNARKNLLKEGVLDEKISVVGNSVIDALYLTTKKLNKDKEWQNKCDEKFSFLNKEKKLILVTGHRRENFGEGFRNICSALFEIAEKEDVELLYPVHLNPKVQECVNNTLSGKENIKLIEPVDYLEMVYLMQRCYLILTDSGGIQEEAPALGKPVLVMRDTTERPEAIETGVARLVGTNKELICSEVNKLLNDQKEYLQIANMTNPFGDGKTAQKVFAVLKKSIN